MSIGIIDKIKPKNGGQFPVYEDVDALGGFQVQPTITSMNAIPSANQKIGMLVYVVANDTFYQLITIGNPGTWTVTSLSGSLLGDVTGAVGANTVINIHGASVPASGSLITGNVLQVTGSSALGYSSINLAGGGNFVTGLLPAINQAPQTLIGDVTGSVASNKVVAITGSSGSVQISAIISGLTSGSGSPLSYGIANIVMPSDANLTLPAAQFAQPILRITSTPTLTATRSIILPITNGAKYDVFNNTTGTQSLLFIGSSGTGVTIPNGIKANIYFDGTNYVPSGIIVGGDLSATTNIAQTVSKLQGNAVESGILGPTQDGYVLTWRNSDNQWEPLPSTAEAVNMIGDVIGTTSANDVASITGSGGIVQISATLEGSLSGSGTPLSYGISNIVMPSDANLTLSISQFTSPILRITSTPTLTTTRSIILPAHSGAKYDVYNNTTGSQSLLFIASTGSGVTVPHGIKAGIYFDGTNYVPDGLIVGGDLSAVNDISQKVIGIDGYAINQNITPTNGQVLAYNSLDGFLEWQTPSSSGTIDGYSVSLGGPIVGQSLVYDNYDGLLEWKSFGTGIYGDGSDGSAICDGTTSVNGMSLAGGNYTLTRDVYFINLIVNTSVNVLGGGYRIFVNNTLTVNGSINVDGQSGTAGGAAGSPPQGVGTHYLGGGSPGLTGSVGGTSNGYGGSGGNCSFGTTGGVVTPPPAGSGGIHSIDVVNGYVSEGGIPVNVTALVLQGGGGGGGAGASTGGGGGGVLVVVALSLVGTGRISANGGAGMFATYYSGGGGGGFIILVTRISNGWSGTIGANGGAAGGPGAFAGGIGTIVQLTE